MASRDLKIDVYRKRLKSGTSFAIKTTSLTMKSFACTTFSKDPKCRTETRCLTTVTWWLILNDFFHHMAWRLTCAV